jgi:hypothetical protein
MFMLALCNNVHSSIVSILHLSGWNEAVLIGSLGNFAAFSTPRRIGKCLDNSFSTNDSVDAETFRGLCAKYYSKEHDHFHGRFYMHAQLNTSVRLTIRRRRSHRGCQTRQQQQQRSWFVSSFSASTPREQ